uniref:Uncharacterized protein n=1 Tax=Callithrix jacchus TaxID=9483 RepID=A0A5F4W4H3_CALJA
YILTGFFPQDWRHSILSHKVMRMGLDIQNQSLLQFWARETYFLGETSSFKHKITVKKRVIVLYPDLSVINGLTIVSLQKCFQDLKSFPLDQQQTTLSLYSYGFTTDDILFHGFGDNNNVTWLTEISLSQFWLIEYKFITKKIIFSTGSFGFASTSFELKKMPGYFLLFKYLPCTLVTILTWLQLHGNYVANAAVHFLGVTTVLFSTTRELSLVNTLPKIRFVKGIYQFLPGLLVYVFMIALQYALCNHIFIGREPKVQKKNSEKAAWPNNRKMRLRINKMGPHEKVLNYFLKIKNGLAESYKVKHISTPRSKLYSSHAKNISYKKTGINHHSFKRNILEKHISKKQSQLLRRLSTILIQIPEMMDEMAIDRWPKIVFPLKFVYFTITYKLYWVQ